MPTSTPNDDAPKGREALSFVVPFYNERDNLRPLVIELVGAAEATQRPFEVLLVDDGSDDDGLEVARELAREVAGLRILHLQVRSGQSAALAAGFHSARHAIVVTLDADLQNDPADIPRLLEHLDRHDVVCGIRRQRQDPWGRRISSKIANSVRNWVTHESITDVGCSLRAIRARYLRDVPTFDGMHRFLPTLLRLQGASVTEIEVNHRPRHLGTTKYGIGNRLWRALADLCGVRWLQKRHVRSQAVEEIEVED